MPAHSVIKKLRIPLSQGLFLLLTAFVAVSGSAWEENLPVVGGVLFLAGVVLVTVGSLGRLWCSLYIGGYKRETLVTEGPYSISRHPLYLFSLLGALGVGCATETFAIPLVLLVVFAAYYPWVIIDEEEDLKKLYGERYDEYVSKTPTFFPKLSRLTEPQRYDVNPVIFRKHMFSAFWFVCLLGVLQLVKTLHQTGVVPILFKTY